MKIPIVLRQPPVRVSVKGLFVIVMIAAAFLGGRAMVLPQVNELRSLVSRLEAQAKPDTTGKLRIREIGELVTYHPTSLKGVGIVVDLTAIDSDESIAVADKQRMLELVQNESRPISSEAIPESFARAPYIRLAMVSADLSRAVPLVDEQLDCLVTLTSAAAFQAGYLMPTHMKCSNSADDAIYGIAKGPVATGENSSRIEIQHGCQVLLPMKREFCRDGKLMLRIHDHFAGMQTSSDIVTKINGRYSRSEPALAKAVDEFLVEITVPKVYEQDVVGFAAEILGLWTYRPGF